MFPLRLISNSVRNRLASPHRFPGCGWFPTDSRALAVAVFCLLHALGVVPGTGAVKAAAAELRAGAARVDITPSQPVLMAGYESRTNLSQGVHDPLSARALAFEQDGQRLVLVSIDNLGFYNQTADPLRAAILETCHLQGSELLLCAIHTHSAPTLIL